MDPATFDRAVEQGEAMDLDQAERDGLAVGRGTSAGSIPNNSETPTGSRDPR
jgi:hypothetical protein